LAILAVFINVVGWLQQWTKRCQIIGHFCPGKSLNFTF